MPINNPIVPIGILYFSKSGSFQKEFDGAASTHLMRRSAHMFWNTMIAVYSSFLSPLSAEVMSRMVMCGDFMLSSLQGVEFVTECVTRNFRAILYHMQNDNTPLLHEVVCDGVSNTSNFTSIEIIVLFRCLLHCCDIQLSTNGSDFNVLSVATTVIDARPVVPTASAFVGLELHVIKVGTKKRSKVTLHRDMHIAFQVRSSFSELELSYLKLIAANAHIEHLGNRNVYMTTIALMRHFDQVDKACAVAVLHGARLMQSSVFTVQDAIEPIVYTNKWLGVSHAVIEERVRDACRDQIVHTQTETILALQAIHPTMFSKESGVFVNALIHMDKDVALHCINAACQRGFASVVVRNAHTSHLLSTNDVQSLFDDTTYDEVSRFDVFLHSKSEFAKASTCSQMCEQIALNVSKNELCALCRLDTTDTCKFKHGHHSSLTRLLTHALDIDDCDMESAFVQTFDTIISTWITLFVHANSNEGRPPKRAVTFR